MNQTNDFSISNRRWQIIELIASSSAVQISGFPSATKTCNCWELGHCLEFLNPNWHFLTSISSWSKHFCLFFLGKNLPFRILHLLTSSFDGLVSAEISERGGRLASLRLSWLVDHCSRYWDFVLLAKGAMQEREFQIRIHFFRVLHHYDLRTPRISQL